MRIKAGDLGAVDVGNKGGDGGGSVISTSKERRHRSNRLTETLPTLTLTVFTYLHSLILRIP